MDKFCWDKDVGESSDCDRKKQVCCFERLIKSSLDETPCGTVGTSIRSPRRQRPVSDGIAKDVCWMVGENICQTVSVFCLPDLFACVVIRP